MRAQPKPDSSYASNRLTRSNRPAKHLLSNFNKRDESPVQPESEPEPEPQSPPHQVQPQPGTDDEPLSSSDNEGSDTDEIPSSAGEGKRKTLTEKLADGEMDTANPTPSTQKSALVRTSDAMSYDERDAVFDSFTQPSSKRSKKSTYRSRAPASSARSAATPEKPSQASQSSSQEGKDNEEPQSESGFKMPIQIDVPSPQKPRAEKEEGSGFKMPPVFPMESISNSNSSLATSSFKDPQLVAVDDGSSLSSLSTPLSSPSSSFLDDLPNEPRTEAENERPPSPPRKALCPMCKAEVDPEMLMLFEAQPKQRVREQQQFCASHQQNTVEKEWTAQGYPEINWDQFDERVQKHFPDIEKLLVPDCNSFYRNILVTSNQSGQSKNFRLTLSGDSLETISCGYYGTRGSQKM